MDGKRKGSSKKDSAAAPAESAPAPHGRSGGVVNERRPPPSLGAGPAKHQASRVNEGKEPASRGRNASPRPRKEGGSLRGESDQAGRRLEPKEKQPGAAQKVLPGALKAGAADAACRKGEKAVEGRKGKSKGVASQAGDSGEAELGASQAQRDEPDPGRADAAAQKKRASQKTGGAPKEASDQKPVRSLREVLKTITLRKEAVSQASERVNKVRDLLIAAIKKDPRFSSIEKQPLGTGSYYEHLKISKPDEFDIMLTLPQLRLDLESCDPAGAFYFVKLKRCPGKVSLNNFLDDEERLSAFKILTELRTIIKEEVKKIEEENVTVKKKKCGCPAVTLLIGEPPSAISVDIILALKGGRHNQCNSTKDGLNIERWLGKKVKQDFCNKPLCLVPKNIKDGNWKDCWRLSFSHIEKDIILCHGSDKTCCEREGKKCCRKACLKLLKYLLELLKTKHENRNQFDKFISYHAKTAFFQACVKWPCDSDWLETDLDDCFEKFLDFFLDCLKNAELRHFFIPEFNFFSTDRIDTAKCRALARAIESERNNRFPIFFLEP